jgi:uncharacterized protein (TIGR03382 family)
MLGAATASAFELRKDSQGDVVRWQRPVTFIVDPGLAAAFQEPRAKQAVLAAIAEVEEATAELDVRMEEGAVKGPGFELNGAGNQNEILTLSDWPYTDGALASTVVTLNARTNEILDTDIVFNVEQHTFRVLDGPAMRDDLDDVQNTLTHELGHALGLMHNAMDQRVVMYPRAAAGEIGKRVLQDDDRQGLAALYGVAPEGPVTSAPQMGCSASPTSAVPWIVGLALAGWLLQRRRPALVRVVARRSRRFAIAAGLIAPGLLAGAAEAQERTPVMTGVVRTTVSHRAASHPGLIVTSLDVLAVTCVGTAPCERQVRVTVPGGRLGDLEQLVEHHPVPAVGETVGLAQRRGRWIVYRLADPQDGARFEALLTGSAATQPRPSSPVSAPQPAAVVR